MASSPPPPGLTSKRLESLSSKKSNRSSDHPDDASSFTSMSSNSNATVCRVCTKAESLTSPLVTCISCRSRYHIFCTNPRIIDRRVDYICGRCVEKAKKRATSAPRAGTDEPINIQRSVETQQATGSQNEPEATIILCEAANCGKPAQPRKAPSTKHLCFMCDLIEKTHANRQLPPPKPKTVSRPIQKTKLYHVRPDDRPLVTNKRKRSSSGYASTIRAEGPRAATGPKTNAYSTETAIPGVLSRGPIREQAKKQRPETPVGRKVPQNPSLPSTIEPSRVSPVIGANPQSGPSLEFSELHRVYRNFLSMKDSPVHGSDVYQVNDASNDNTYSKSEGRPITQGARSPMSIATEITQAPHVASPIEDQLAPLEPIITYPEMPSQESPLDAAEDDAMLDSVEPDTFTQSRPLFPQPPSPLSDSSSQISSPKGPIFDDDIEQVETPAAIEPELASELSEESSSFDTSRDFDESELDSFIQKQSQRDPLYEPSPTELLETQRWGAMDPRTVWPNRLSAAQKEQKMLEIAARGGRKKNFGKILHQQLVQERMERGWDIHQSRDKRDDDETTEMIHKLEELFGVPEGILGNCVPKTINGRLVMQEREREPEPRRSGRQKKEVPLGAFRVVGGQ
ncbi:hypothetical protein DL98DRAFT_515343 [Cadophora sp. DSE1049]|nr:hypothetical protein DL98DRAFT_515343 [Cadophora sp. DSE1049]